MPAARVAIKLERKEVVMGTLFTVIVASFVIAVLFVVGYALFELSPFGRHSEHYRNPLTGKRRWDPPNLEDGHY